MHRLRALRFERDQNAKARKASLNPRAGLHRVTRGPERAPSAQRFYGATFVPRNCERPLSAKVDYRDDACDCMSCRHALTTSVVRYGLLKCKLLGTERVRSCASADV
jgi:hypothetical protein